jgi:hypothetical protein
MSSLVQVGRKSWANPYGIYDGPRIGDEFLEWNMGDVVRRVPTAAVLNALGELYNMGQLDQLFGAAKNLFGDAVESIEFRSQVTPTVVVNKPFAPQAPGAPAPQPQIQGGSPASAVFLDKFAKPAIYIHLTGGTVLPIEPYGTPKDDYTGLVIAGVGIAAGIGLFAGISIGKWIFCPK